VCWPPRLECMQLNVPTNILAALAYIQFGRPIVMKLSMRRCTKSRKFQSSIRYAGTLMLSKLAHADFSAAITR
jgi:hypothetical protein